MQKDEVEMRMRGLTSHKQGREGRKEEKEGKMCLTLSGHVTALHKTVTSKMKKKHKSSILFLNSTLGTISAPLQPNLPRCVC